MDVWNHPSLEVGAIFKRTDRLKFKEMLWIWKTQFFRDFWQSCAHLFLSSNQSYARYKADNLQESRYAAHRSAYKQADVRWNLLGLSHTHTHTIATSLGSDSKFFEYTMEKFWTKWNYLEKRMFMFFLIVRFKLASISNK